MNTPENEGRPTRVDSGGDIAWQAVCRIDDLIPEAGVAVRAHGVQVALFLMQDEIYAVDNFDPFCGAAVVARGIVGDWRGELVVASPMYKQHFNLSSGVCVEDPGVRLRCWPVRREPDGRLSVGLPNESTAVSLDDRPCTEVRHETAE